MARGRLIGESGATENVARAGMYSDLALQCQSRMLANFTNSRYLSMSSRMTAVQFVGIAPGVAFG